MSFEHLSLISPLLEALKKEGYTSPTPIQKEAIPHILAGKDILGCAQTGTGKTAAFTLPILQLLHGMDRHGERKIRALVVTPTRELAIQIGEKFHAYGKHLSLRHSVVFGGVSQNIQVRSVRSGIDILVATPGRLLDLMEQRIISLEHVTHFVLDEADRMLDMGFINDVKKIIAKLPQKRQSLFFSATMPPVIVDLTKKILVDPVRIEVTPESTTAETVRQAVLYVDKSRKPQLLIHMLKRPAMNSVLVFTRTKYGADKVVKFLKKEAIGAMALHGNKSQNERQRALESFKSGKISVLVATDIAARGIDISGLPFVINYEIPNIPETYVHRIGRTGRAGLTGTAFSFCDVEERPYLRDIEKLLPKPITVITDHPFPAPEPLPKPASEQRATAPRRGVRSFGRRRGR